MDVLSNNDIIEKLHDAMMESIALETAINGGIKGEIGEALGMLAGSIVADIRMLRDALKEQWNYERLQ